MSNKKYKILIIEDEEYIAKILKDRINKFGYEVIGTACTGEKAIEIIKDIKADLILMDIILRIRKDGIETARDIKEISDIPIIFITGCCKEDFIDRIKNILQVGYLLKPFRENELYKSIKLALNN